MFGLSTCLRVIPHEEAVERFATATEEGATNDFCHAVANKALERCLTIVTWADIVNWADTQLPKPKPKPAPQQPVDLQCGPELESLLNVPGHEQYSSILARASPGERQKSYKHNT